MLDIIYKFIKDLFLITFELYFSLLYIVYCFLINSFILKIKLWFKKHYLEQNVKELESQDFVQEWKRLMVAVFYGQDVEREEKEYPSNSFFKKILN